MGLGDWGQALADAAKSAGNAASSMASQAYNKAVQAADQAVAAAKAAGVSAYQTAMQAASDAADQAKKAAEYAADKAKQAANYAVDKGVQAAKSVGAVGLLGAEAVAVAGAAVPAAGAVAGYKTVQAAKSAYQAVHQAFHPAQPVVVPCVACLASQPAEARAKRIQMRNALIQKANQNPALQNPAKQLQDDMKAVELARLSQNTYKQSFDDPSKPALVNPPEPWAAMTDDQLRAAGLDPKMLKAAKAVIYTQNVPGFPFKPTTVLAFRGTDPSDPNDLITDHDQALGLETAQYKAAMAVGRDLARSPLGQDTEVTGHSLGGGLAQAAGIVGGMPGEMFNSAGLNPETMHMTPDALNSFAQNFTQYRSEGDPLTGLQNSLDTQKKVVAAVGAAKNVLGANQWALNQLGLGPITDLVPEGSRDLATEAYDRLMNVTTEQAAKNFAASGGKWYIPPALGPVKPLASKNFDGSDTPTGLAPSSLLAQHSVDGVVNGLEYRKFNNIETLLQATNTPGDAADYLGPTLTEMR